MDGAKNDRRDEELYDLPCVWIVDSGQSFCHYLPSPLGTELMPTIFRTVNTMTKCTNNESIYFLRSQSH
jgi:hypothetical protein